MEDLTGSVTLLRGVALSDILWRGGKLFQNSTGSARTYRLSVPVDHLESFISHTWNTPRWKKHLALSCEFNFAGALAVSFLVGVVITLLCALKLLPLADIVYLDGVEMPGAPYCTFTVPVVFHVLLSGGCDPVFHFSKPRFFVDKACIYQTDEALKQHGIENLSMFIFFSWDLVILYSKSYLQRLWTVYELASFLVLHPLGRIRMLNLETAPVVLFASTVCAFQEWAAFLPLSVLRQVEWLIWIPSTISVLVVFILWRRQAKTQSKSIDELVSRFSVRSAACFSEADRAPVERNIVEMLKSQGLLAGDGGHEEGIALFDELVRVHLPPALRTKYTYCDALIVGVVLVGQGFDAVASCLSADESWRFLATRGEVIKHTKSVKRFVCVGSCVLQKNSFLQWKSTHKITKVDFATKYTRAC